MKQHLILAGCGHVHLTALANLSQILDSGHKVTVVSPSDYLYYSGMGPGLLGGIYRPQEIRFHVRKIVEKQGAEFILDLVKRIQPQSRCLHLESGKTINYDVVSFNTGSYVPLEAQEKSGMEIFPVKPIERLQSARLRQLELGKDRGKVRLVVVGGGAAGLEIVCGAWRAVQDAGCNAEIRLVTRGRLLSQFPPKVRSLALASLIERGICVEEGFDVNRYSNRGPVSRDGREWECDLVLAAGGICPSRIFRGSDLPVDGQGALQVSASLNSPRFPEVFGGGDCVSFLPRPLDKVGVFAVRQNPVLFFNLTAALQGDPLRAFHPQRSYTLILNLGNGRAIYCRGSRAWEGRWAFWLKDRIDCAFMRRFQVSDERHI